MSTDHERAPSGRIDVTDLPVDRLDECATDADVHLERRGGHTYLVAPTG